MDQLAVLLALLLLVVLDFVSQLLPDLYPVLVLEVPVDHPPRNLVDGQPQVAGLLDDALLLRDLEGQHRGEAADRHLVDGRVYLALYDGFGLDCELVVAWGRGEEGGGGVSGLVEVGLGVGEVGVLGCGQDADGDVVAVGLEGEGIEDAVVVHEEVQVQPEGVREDDLRELLHPAPPHAHRPPPLLLRPAPSQQPPHQLQVLRMRAFLPVFLEREFVVEHEGDEFMPLLADHDEVDLFGDDLILHPTTQTINYTPMELPAPDHDHTTEQSLQDACFHPQSHFLLPQPQGQKQKREYESSFENNFAVVAEGYLEKKTLNSTWQLRYFLLTPVRLLYFADSQRKHLKGCFNLASLVEHRLEIRLAFPHIALLVQAPPHSPPHKLLLTLQIADAATFQEWSCKLQQVAVGLRSLEPHLLGDFPRLLSADLLQSNQKIGNSNGNFWNKLTISCGELLRYAGHLDILFLRSRNPLFYLHRFFMRSYYDHVAILVKDEAERVHLFEAVQSKGVCLSSLHSLLLSYSEDYEEIGYRKLLPKHPKLLQLDSLEDYINSLIGKKYELSISKLLIANQTEGEDEIEEAEQEKQKEEGKPEKTYFCSELIADIYLKFGILAEGKSNQFWPKDFEEDELHLSEGFTLSPMMSVDFDLPHDHSEHSEVD